MVNNKSRVIIELNYNGIDRKWVVSAMGNDLTSTADSLLASNPAEAAKQGIAPKGLYNIGDDLDFFKFSDEKNPQKTETDYSDKSDGNGALFTLNGNASEELKRQVKAMQACVGEFLDQDGAEYARRFKEKYGIAIDPDEAKVIAALAISENRSAKQKYVAAQNAVNAWAYFRSFNPVFDFIVEFAGENFKLNPGNQYINLF